ncbi:MAG: hypothetical protein A2Y33_07310 [Spirochaetes bacterium GWF1_51_8]|nr:MAG: hypothetical protein A2Y33_07310 [Spirochaetes bacterium GWF1_51_8]
MGKKQNAPESASKEHGGFSELNLFPSALIVLSPTGHVLYANRKAEVLFEFAPGKLEGLLFESLLYEATREPFRARFPEFFKSPESYHIELELNHSHRETIYLHADCGLRGDGTLLLVLNDITGLKIAAEALSRSSSKYRSLVESIPAITYITSGDIPSHAIYFSPQTMRILGYTQEEFAELFDGYRKSIIHPQDRGKVEARLRETRETGVPFVCEYRISAKDGEYHWVHDEGVIVHNEFGQTSMRQGVLFDITERVESQRRFEIQHAHLDALIDSLREAVAITNNRGVITRVNPEFVNLFGYSKKEAVGKNIIELLTPPASRDKAFKYFVQVLNGSTLSIDTKKLKSDGTLIDVSLLGAPIMMGDNEIGVYEIFRDITERKKSDEAIRKQYIFLWNILNSLPYPFYIIRVEDRQVIMMNSHAEYLCGGRDEKGTCIERIQSRNKICSRDYPCPLDIVLATRRPAVIEHIISSDPKNPLYHEIHAYPIFDEKERIVEMIEYTLDITERKKSEIERKRLATAIDQTSNVVMMTNTRGDIEFVNKAFEQVTGYKKEEVIGKNPHILKTNLQPREFYKELWKNISSGKVWYGEFLNRKKDGSTYWAEAAISPIKNEKGEIVNYIGIQEDITHKKEAETQLYRAKEAAEVANRMKSEFLANVSHEIRTPLNSILGFTQILLDDTKEPQNKELLEIIDQSGRNLLYIISDILDFSKIEAGKMIVESVPIVLNDVLRDIRNLFLIEAKEKNLAFEIIIDKNVPPFVIGDLTKIRQVILNLVSNAFKFTKKGKITVEIDYYYGTALIKVTDTGIGIPKDKLKSIFSPFEQADASHTREYGGTGLGLTITKKLTELMGGKISVESRTGRGSSFSVTIPLLPATASSAAGTSGQNAPVFLSEKDEHMVLKWLEKMNGDRDLENIFFEGLRNLPERLRVLEDSVIRENIREIKFHAHDLKGSMGNLGMKEIFELAREIEKKTDPGKTDFSAIRTHLKTMKEIMDKIPDHYLHKSYFPSQYSAAPGVSDTVLIVDDNELNRKLLQTLLSKMGLFSDAAVQGKEAIEILRKKSYRLLIMDIYMPEMDGIETIRKIREMPGTDMLFAIALTANTGKTVVEKAMSAGFNDFISKPIDRILFEKKIKRILSRKFDEKPVRAQSISDGENAPAIDQDHRAILDGIIRGLKDNCKIFNSKEVLRLSEELRKSFTQPYYRDIAERLMNASHEFDDEVLCEIVKKLEE